MTMIIDSIERRRGSGSRQTFTVCKQPFGVGVERTFPLYPPTIGKLEIAGRGDVRRAKLYSEAAGAPEASGADEPVTVASDSGEGSA